MNKSTDENKNRTAVDEINATYSLENFKEIAEHGCVSGVCHEHIYYYETIPFYDTFEDEIISYLEEEYDTEHLIELFAERDSDLTSYKNSVVWAFIEIIASEVVEEHKESIEK